MYKIKTRTYYNTRNSTQYSIITYMRKEYEKKNRYMYI